MMMEGKFYYSPKYNTGVYLLKREVPVLRSYNHVRLRAIVVRADGVASLIVAAGERHSLLEARYPI